MSRSAAAASLPLPFELVTSDGIPMDDDAHVIQLHLLKDLVRQVMAERGRKDYFCAGNVFVYYSIEQAWDVVKGRPYFRGPDFFFVDGAEPRNRRKAWVSWEEGDRLPDLIVEMLSPSSEVVDRGVKKDLYARVFGTPEYFVLDLDAVDLEAFRLEGDTYEPIPLNDQGRFRSEVLGLDLSFWYGVRDNRADSWLRLYYPDGRLVLTGEEAANQRAEAAEAELRRLRARLGEE